MQKAEVRVLPCQDEEGVVRCSWTWGGATVGEVGPVAGEEGVEVVIIYFLVSNNCVGGVGSGVEFGNCGC